MLVSKKHEPESEFSEKLASKASGFIRRQMTPWWTNGENATGCSGLEW